MYVLLVNARLLIDFFPHGIEICLVLRSHVRYHILKATYTRQKGGVLCFIFAIVHRVADAILKASEPLMVCIVAIVILTMITGFFQRTK
jgi:hypothetical protein